MADSDIMIRSGLEGIEKAAAFVDKALQEHHVDEVVAYRVRLAIDEAVTNVVKHGYKDEPGDIWLSLSIDDKAIVAIVKDKARPFDMTKYPPPDVEAELEKREVGGLGVLMIRKMMDKVEYARVDGMNVTTMSIRI